jgi:Ca2+-binding RTX toxin-like protein
MATMDLRTGFNWSYDAAERWGHLANWEVRHNQPTYITLAPGYELLNGPYFIVHGTDLAYKNQKLISGEVSGITVVDGQYSLYIADIEISAKVLSSLMRQNTAESGAKILKTIFAGDDEVTTGFANDRIATFGGDDNIDARSGNDWIDAGSGNDILNGNTGNDFLIGGSGKDMFVFDTKAGPKNMDTIDDFSGRDDTIVLDHLVFRTVGKVGDLEDAAFHSSTTGKAHDASDRVIYNSKTGDLFYDADGSGAGPAVRFAHLDPGLKLTAADFDLI